MSTSDVALLPAVRRPAPPVLPSGRLLGHLARFRDDALGLFLDGMKLGGVVRIRVAGRSILALYDPEHVHHVLGSHASNYSKRTRGYKALRALLGQGLLTAEGEVWKRERRIAQPAFHPARMVGFASTMARATADLALRWEAAAQQGQPLDLAEEMGRLTLRIAGETLFSLDISKETDVVGPALATVLGGFIRGVLNPLAAALPLPSTLRHRAAIRTLDGVVRDIIARRRAEGGQHADLLGMLMAARDEETGAAMSDEQLRDEVLTMLLAGHETTANALAWTLYQLSQHPEVARRVEAEVDALAPLDGLLLPRPGSLPYLDRVIRESLRLHPPAWVASRMALEDDEIGGYPIPAGTFVYVSQYAIHRNPDLWSDPDAFDPDRFLPERAVCPDGRPRPRFAWFPFGAGPRKCIGETFAMMELQIVLAELIRHYQFELAPGAKVVPEPTVTLRPRGGLPMILKRRDAATAG